MQQTSLVVGIISVVSSVGLRTLIVIPPLKTRLTSGVLLAPIAEEEPSKKHSSEVGKVRHVSVGSESRIGFDESISDDEVFGFHRDGRNEEHDALVGEGHAECQKHSIASTTRSDGDPLIEDTTHGNNVAIDIGSIILRHSGEVVFSKLPQLLTESCTNATDKIVDDEAFLSHSFLYDASKHPQTKHIEQYVTPRSVEKHIGEWLVDAKSWS